MRRFSTWKLPLPSSKRSKGDDNNDNGIQNSSLSGAENNEERGDDVVESNGLFPLEPPGVAAEASAPFVDVIAVHGLGGHWQKTWTAENGKMWLRDFLPAQLLKNETEAALWSYGYNSSTALSAAVTDVTDEAEMLLDRIHGERNTPEEKAMIRAQERSDLYGELLSKIHGIVFLGTPHRGSDVAWWASFPANLLKALQLGTGTNTVYLKALTRNSAEFSQISQQWVERSKNLIIRTFFETEMLFGILVVDKDSARLNLPNEVAVGLAGSNHRTMCKFESANSQRYRPVLNAIKRVVAEVRQRAMKDTTAAGAESTPDEDEMREQLASLMKTLGRFDYFGYRRRNPERESGTCEWITRHPQFREWLTAEHFGILWISGDPGCGKSVAASYLIDYLGETQPSALTTYFFFKDDSDKQSKSAPAISSILHQILSESSRYSLAEKIMRTLAKRGEDVDTRFLGLWQLFLNVLSDDACGDIIIVLDAMDECAEDERNPLVAALTDLGRNQNLFSAGRSLKVLTTSRPYAAIRRAFKGYQTIRLQAENSLDEIDLDIKAVVSARVERFASSMDAAGDERLLTFKERLQTKADHTFLWVSLILDLLDQSDDCTFEEIYRLMDDPNPGVDALYERMLSKARNPDKARRMLHIVVGAVEPLSLDEINTAWAVKIGERLTDKELAHRAFPSPEIGVRETCGLFVRIVEGKVVLVHQTAREFLVRSQDTAQDTRETCGSSTWKWSLKPAESAQILAMITTTYLMSNPTKSTSTTETDRFIAGHPFIAHAANYLLTYVQGAAAKPEVVELYSELLTTETFTSWFIIHNRLNYTSIARLKVPPLLLALNLKPHPEVFVQCLLKRGENADSINYWGQTVLQVAVRRGDIGVVGCLIEAKADLDKDRDHHGTPLHIAVQCGNADVVQLLLRHGANRLARDVTEAIPLHYAQKAVIVSLLLGHLADEQVRSLDWCGYPPWRRMLQVKSSVDGVLALDALLRAMPMDMQDEYEEFVRLLETEVASRDIPRRKTLFSSSREELWNVTGERGAEGEADRV